MESGVAYMGDAQFDEWVTTLDALKKLDWDTDLPGHGAPFHDKALVTAFQGYLTDLVKQGTDLKQRGVSAEEAAQRVDLTAYQERIPADSASRRRHPRRAAPLRVDRRARKALIARAAGSAPERRYHLGTRRLANDKAANSQGSMRLSSRSATTS